MMIIKQGIPNVSGRVIAVFVGICCMCAGIFLTVIKSKESLFSACDRALRAHQYKRAVSKCDQAYEKNGSPKALGNVAHALYLSGNYEALLDRFEELRKGGNQALALYLAGKVYERQGKPKLARAHLNQALVLYQAAGKHAEVAKVAHWLAGSYRNEASYGQALAYSRRAYAEAQRADDTIMQGYVLLGMANVLIRLGAHLPAEQALKAAEQVLATKESQVRAWVPYQTGMLYKELGRFGLARVAFERSLQLADNPKHQDSALGAKLYLACLDLKEGDYKSAAAGFEQVRALIGSRTDMEQPLLYNQGRLALALGDYDLAERTLAQAAAMAKDPQWIWNIAFARGEVAEQRLDTAGATKRYREAIKILETARNKLKESEYKSWLLASKQEPYEALFALQARSGRIHQALQTMEQAQGRAFVDTFIAATAQPMTDAPTAMDEPIARVDTLRRILPSLSRSPIATTQPIQKILTAIRHANVLGYFCARGRVWLVFLAAGKTPRLTQLAASSEQIEILAAKFLANPDDLELSSKLGRILLPEGWLPEAGTPIYISPGRLLRRLPFGALRRADRFVIEDHAISYVPSLTALAAMTALPPQACQDAVVLGNARGDLVGAQREVESVAAILGVGPYTGQNATMETFRNGHSASVLHLATHAGISVTGAWLDLSDRRVGVPEILEWRMHPRLAVVASCASAVTQTPDTWGSLAAAFLASGTPTVLATLWSVDDMQTTDLIQRFYQAGGNHNQAEALAQAQRSLARTERVSAWAPFVLHGVLRSRCAN